MLRSGDKKQIAWIKKLKVPSSAVIFSLPFSLVFHFGLIFVLCRKWAEVGPWKAPCSEIATCTAKHNRSRSHMYVLLGPGFKEFSRPTLGQRTHSQLWFLDHWSTKKTAQPLCLPLGGARRYLSRAETFRYTFAKGTLMSYAVVSLSLNTSSQQSRLLPRSITAQF